MFFSKKIAVSYNSDNKNFKLQIEDRFKKETPKDKLHTWPAGYKRFSMPEKSEEDYYVKPQKFNYKIILFSVFVVFLLWFAGLRYIEKNKKVVAPEENAVKVLIAQSSDIGNDAP